jgi:hypothetical protein
MTRIFGLLLIALLAFQNTQAHAQLECESVLRDVQFILKTFDSTQTEKLKTMMRIVERRKLSDTPLVQFLSAAIGRGEEKLIYRETAAFSGSTTYDSSRDMFTVRIDAFISSRYIRKLPEKGVLGLFFRIPTARRVGEEFNIIRSFETAFETRPAGVDLTFAEAMYGIVKGVNRFVADHPNIKTVKINAGRVVNPALAKMLMKFGFKSFPCPPLGDRLELILVFLGGETVNTSYFNVVSSSSIESDKEL